MLARKFARNREELSRVAVFLSTRGELVARSQQVLEDQPDNRILECALAASAGTTVTGDRAMHTLGSFKGVQTLSLVEYPDDANAH
ncbi:MAG: hypothetical protein CMO26_06245 [Thiotrichales bacterium]|nr:hypothetical protein [Thiotrichales bacterium]